MNRISFRWALCVLTALLVALTPALAMSAAFEAGVQEEVAYEALYEGDRGDAVARMQRALLSIGYLPGAPDGVYGPGTQAAVAAFQADYLPDEPAHATPRTLERLYEAAAAVDLDKTVYIAPYSGERYHEEPTCWGLRSARSVESVTLSSALDQGKARCKICYD